jgi:carboxymethylenebutenolidase
LNAAMLFPDELDATVIYYGQVIDDEDMLRPMNVPVLGLFGGADTGVPAKSVQAFEASLERLRKQYEIQIYPGAKQAFANPTGRYYNAEAADDAWEKTLEFLGRNLVGTTADTDD